MSLFHEFVEKKDFEALDKAVLRVLGVTDKGLSNKLVSSEGLHGFLDNPEIRRLMADAGNPEAITSAVNNAGITNITVADLIGLFRAGSDRKREIKAGKKDKGDKRPAAPMPPPPTSAGPPDQGQEPPPEQPAPQGPPPAKKPRGGR